MTGGECLHCGAVDLTTYRCPVCNEDWVQFDSTEGSWPELRDLPEYLICVFWVFVIHAALAVSARRSRNERSR